MFGQWKDTIRKARKEYTCSYCSKVIELSQTYVHWKSVGIDEDDGKFKQSESREHLSCRESINKESEMLLDALGDIENDHMWEHRYP